jgi:cell division septation protein DedD
MSGTKKYEIQFTKKQIFFTVTALISSFFLAFASGILIGNRFLDNKKTLELASSDQNALVKSPSLDNRPSESSKNSPAEEKKNDTQFTFYKTLPERSELLLAKEVKKEKASQDKRISSKKGSSKRVKQFDQDIVRKGYTIQLGSFQQKEKAYALQNKLKKHGYLVYVTPKTIENKGIWYRVRMGNFNTPEEAQGWVSKLGNLSPPPFITSATD